MIVALTMSRSRHNLDAAGISYVEDPTLWFAAWIHYTRTVFEVEIPTLALALSAVAVVMTVLLSLKAESQPQALDLLLALSALCWR